MAAKRGFRVHLSIAHARSAGAGPRRGRVAIAVVTVTATCLFAASPALADTGGVYFDSNDNAAAGDPAQLFNGSFTGGSNVGLGRSVMPNLTDGIRNTATGTGALAQNTSGAINTASGWVAMGSNTEGGGNVAIGSQALYSSQSNFNVAVGADALIDTTGGENIGLGHSAGSNLSTGSFNIDIGNDGVNAGESKTIRIGTKGDQTRTFIAGINGKTVSGTATPVVVNDKGQLGTASAVSAEASGAKRLSATVRGLVATVKRQQRQIQRQGREIRGLRAQR